MKTYQAVLTDGVLTKTVTLKSLDDAAKKAIDRASQEFYSAGRACVIRLNKLVDGVIVGSKALA